MRQRTINFLAAAIVAFAFAFMFDSPPVYAGLPSSGVEERTGTTPTMTTVEAEYTVTLVKNKPTRALTKIDWEVPAPDDVDVLLCRMDPVPSCLIITGTDVGSTTLWHQPMTTAPDYQLRFTPHSGVPIAPFAVKVKLYYM